MRDRRRGHPGVINVHDTGTMETTRAVSQLAALAQASRLQVFRHLVERAPGGAHPGDIAQALGLPANTLSFHLRTLLQAGLVEAEPNGRFIRYRAALPAMRALLDYLTENCCAGDPAACAPPVPACRPERTA
jgi:DNA-binding transcriptional ArsR family regulator